MRALVFNKKLQYTNQYPDPQPGPGEVLIAVKLASICATDLEIARGYMAFSGVLGHEFVGTVAKGPQAWKNKRVVAEINCVCGKCRMCQQGLANHCQRRTVLGIDGRDGVFADLVAVPERNLYEVPQTVSDEQAVFVEPLAAAFQVIKQCPIEKRQRAVVVGSGRLGLLVAQVLKTTGCKLEVVGRNQLTLDFCEKKGIQTRHIADMIPRPEHDVVVECSGSSEGFELAMKLTRPRGTLVLKSTHAGAAPLNLSPLVVNEINLVGSRCGPFSEAINALARREIDVESMISRQLSLDRAVEAMAMAEDAGYVKILLKVGA
ncbi:MAG: alcohol dehydrogenase catalytic domain-containing protein [Phycisphaerales bacterium]|nr:alcohol dehydrogenase catalytic domain-containing protein [Phycisphaerales bacterium]